MRLVAGFPPRRPGFKPGSGHTGYCGGQKWRWGRFSPRTSVSLANLHSICFSTIIFTVTRGWHKRPRVAAVPIPSQTKLKKRFIGEWMYRSTFSSSTLVGGEWSASRPCRFTPGERAHDAHWIGGWVDPRAGMEDAENTKLLTLPGLELRPLGRPARSQSLYRLSYPDSLQIFCYTF
jgi:hypothetical protein